MSFVFMFEQVCCSYLFFKVLKVALCGNTQTTRGQVTVAFKNFSSSLLKERTWGLIKKISVSQTTYKGEAYGVSKVYPKGFAHFEEGFLGPLLKRVSFLRQKEAQKFFNSLFFIMSLNQKGDKYAFKAKQNRKEKTIKGGFASSFSFLFTKPISFVST